MNTVAAKIVTTAASIMILVFAIWYTQPGAPKAIVSTKVVDFGVVPPEQRVSKKVLIKNEGQSNLIISSVKSGCGCTEVAVSPYIVFPNEMATMVVTMKLDAGNAENGRSTQIMISTNDPSNRVIQLMAMAAPAVADIGFPKTLDFGRITRSELPITRKIVRNSVHETRDQYELRGMEDAPWFKSQSIESNTGDSGWDVTVDSTAPVGEIFSRLVAVNLQSQAEEEILCKGIIAGDVLAVPSMAAIGPIHPTNPTAVEHVWIKWRDQDKESTDPLLESSVRMIRLSERLQEFVQCRLTTQAGKVIVEIEVQSDHPSFFLSTRNITGTLDLEIQRPSDRPEILSLPISLSIKIPRIQ